MRKSAAEYIRHLEARIARLERQAGRFRMDRGTRNRILDVLKKEWGASKITNEKVVGKEEYSDGDRGYIVKIDTDADEAFVVITQVGRDQNFYDIFEDRSDAEDAVYHDLVMRPSLRDARG